MADKKLAELSVGHGLRVLQAAMVYINTLMIQDQLAQPSWPDVLTVEDKRGLTPLIWAHISPYGEIRLDMQNRLKLAA